MLRFSIKTYHAINCLTELAAAQSGEQLLSVSALSRKQGISACLLEQLFLQLRKAGYLISVRGPKGGYRLAKPAHTIKIFDLIETLEGQIYFQRCKGKQNCTHQKACPSHDFLASLDRAWRTKFSQLTLYGLTQQKSVLIPDMSL